MEVAAYLKYARLSPQKCRLVADLITRIDRGKSTAIYWTIVSKKAC